MKRIGFFGFVFSFLVVAGIFGVQFEVSFAETNACTSNCGSGGTCSCESMSACVSPKTTVSTDNGYCRGIDNKAVCCKTPSSATCTGGGCKATCDTAKKETEDTACSASQCASQPINKKYCKMSGTPTPTVKCDPAKFKEYAGVCFPLNTGLSETSVAKIVINLMKWMLYLFGFLAIISFVISGIQYLAAAGNMNMIETAKRNMMYSIVGVIVALAGLVIIIAIDALLRGTAWGA